MMHLSRENAEGKYESYSEPDNRAYCDNAAAAIRASHFTDDGRAVYGPCNCGLDEVEDGGK